MGFKGGYSFTRFEGTGEPVVRTAPIPETVSIALTLSDVRFIPSVTAGDHVSEGLPIAKDAGGGLSTLCASINGTVVEIAVDFIRIDASPSSGKTPVTGHTRQPWLLDRPTLFDLFVSSGCSLISGGLPTSIIEGDKLSALVINAVHNGPLDQAWTPTLNGNTELFINGLRILTALYPNVAITVAVNKRNCHYFEQLIASTVMISVLSDKYPQENPELIIRDSIGKRLTAPNGSRNGSLAVIDVADVEQIADIMASGNPLIERLLLVAGPGVSHPGWYRVRIGTPIAALKKSLMKEDDLGPWRVIRGGLFDGVAIDDADFIRATDSVITVIREGAVRELYRFMRPGFVWDSYAHVNASDVLPILPKRLDTNLHGGERPCVQCNFCDEVCPVSLYPFLIWKYVTAGNVEASFKLKPFDCVGCGLCDYVCPSKIPVSAAVGKAAAEYRSSVEGK